MITAREAKGRDSLMCDWDYDYYKKVMKAKYGSHTFYNTKSDLIFIAGHLKAIREE